MLGPGQWAAAVWRLARFICRGGELRYGDRPGDYYNDSAMPVQPTMGGTMSSGENQDPRNNV
jgi:hypothetical protein